MNRRERRVVRAGLALGVFLGLVGCRATAPQAPAETVGAMAAGPSVYSAPVHAPTPPSETYAVRARRERQAAPSAAVEAPVVEAKGQGLTVGGSR